MIDKTNLVTVRDATPGDRNFILATWLRGLRFGNDWFRIIPSDIYFTAYHAYIEAILAKPNTTVKIACLKDDTEVVLGYAVYTGDRLDWVFVKQAWRAIGLAKSLVPQSITSVSHLTKVGLSLLKRRPNVIFNPFDIT